MFGCYDFQRFRRSWSRERSATPPHWRTEQNRLQYGGPYDNRDNQGRWNRGNRMDRNQPDRRSREENTRGEARERVGWRDRNRDDRKWEGRGQSDHRQRFQRGRQRSPSER